MTKQSGYIYLIDEGRDKWIKISIEDAIIAKFVYDSLNKEQLYKQVFNFCYSFGKSFDIGVETTFILTNKVLEDIKTIEQNDKVTQEITTNNFDVWLYIDIFLFLVVALSIFF